MKKKEFFDLIDYKLKNIQNRIFDKFNIQIEFTKNVCNVLYANGVFPAQGTRPLFSTINNIIENSLPLFVYQCLLTKKNNIIIDIDEDKELIFSKSFSGEPIQQKINLQISTMRKNITEEEINLISVHETGHALAYMLLFKVVPIQIIGNSVDIHNSGFTLFNNQKIYNTENIIKVIEVCLAGKVVEKIIFKNTLLSIGSRKDIAKATEWASTLVREMGIRKWKGEVKLPIVDSANYSLTNMENTNFIINNIIKKAERKVQKLIKENIKVFQILLKEVRDKKIIFAEDIYLIMQPYIKDIIINKDGSIITNQYKPLTDKFLKDRYDI